MTMTMTMTMTRVVLNGHQFFQFGDKVVNILNTYHDAYITKVTGFLDGKIVAAATNEESEVVPAHVDGGFISGIAEKIGSPIGGFISGDTVVAIVAAFVQGTWSRKRDTTTTFPTRASKFHLR